MKRRTAWILVAGVAAVAVGAAAVGAVALLLRGSAEGGSGWSGSTYLSLGLSTEVPEHPTSDDIGSLLERHPPSLRTLVESLDRAAGDASVKGVIARIGFLEGAGWGKVQDLRDAIVRFRKSGKPAYAHLEFCGNKEYYLASACSKVYAAPTALLDISGLSAEVTFFRGTLDKLGVQAQFEGVGRYKNAPNQFTETGLTGPHREQMEALVESLYGQYVEAIAKGRGKTAEEVRQLVDAGPYDGAEALKVGLVDELLYQDQVEAKLSEAGRTTPSRYLRSARGLGMGSRPKLAIVYATGQIVSGESQSGGLGGEFAGSDTVSRSIRRAREDGSVKAIVLRVDSPGGSGTASDAIWREVELARKTKPVVASMGDVAASGGYYIAMGSDAIVAQPGTITGSIGVFGGKFSLRGLYDKIGIDRATLKRGEHSDLFSDYRPWTDSERAKVRSLMVGFYRDFIEKAAGGRHKSPEEIDALAQGRVWTGADAVKNGLVDRLGGLSDALSLAKQKAHIPDEQEVALLVLPERKSVWETLLERQEDVSEAVPGDIRALLRWTRLLSRGGPAAHLPFELRIR